MHGTIESLQVAIIFISLLGAILDLLFNRIFNIFTLTSAVIGVVACSCVHGWTGASDGILGILGGFLFYSWLFGLRILGGGDVKFLMALGAWGGFHFIQEVAILGILVGGLLSLGMLVIKGKLSSFVHKFSLPLMSLFVKELEFQLPKVDQSLKMPFGVSIAIAAIWVTYYDFSIFSFFQ